MLRASPLLMKAAASFLQSYPAACTYIFGLVRLGNLRVIETAARLLAGFGDTIRVSDEEAATKHDESAIDAFDRAVGLAKQ